MDHQEDVKPDDAPNADAPRGESAEPNQPAPKDASFEDSFQPVRVAARDAEDLKVFSALLQDAVVRVGDMAFLPKERRFAMVVNRYRWEEPSFNERVRAGAHFDGVLSARTRGFDPTAQEQPLSLLEIQFTPTSEDGLGGLVRLIFAGDAEAALQVEALEAALADIGQPWRAAARPLHR